MEYKLYINAEKELANEARRLVPLLYNNKSLLYCNIEKIKDYINPIYNEFSILVEFRLIDLCYELANNLPTKSNNKFEKSINHYKKYIKYKKEKENIDLYSITKKIMKEMESSYKNQSLFEVIPILSKKYINGHYDSVDYMCILILMDEINHEFNGFKE